MKINFESMPEWLQRLLLFWGVGAFFVAAIFLFLAFIHIAVVGALIGIIIFVGQSIYRFFVPAEKIKPNASAKGNTYENDS